MENSNLEKPQTAIIRKIYYEMGEYKINLKGMCLNKRSIKMTTNSLKTLAHKSMKIVDEFWCVRMMKMTTEIFG